MPPGAHCACRLCLACAIGVSQGATQEFALEPRSCPLPWWYLMLSVVLYAYCDRLFYFSIKFQLGCYPGKCGVEGRVGGNVATVTGSVWNDPWDLVLGYNLRTTMEVTPAPHRRVGCSSQWRKVCLNTFLPMSLFKSIVTIDALKFKIWHFLGRIWRLVSALRELVPSTEC